jgi:hypothetical protein
LERPGEHAPNNLSESLRSAGHKKPTTVIFGPALLTKLRIDEISAVDAAANGGAKIVLYKRALL